MQSRNLLTHPLRVALVGCGRWGSCIAKTLTSLPEYDLAWVCDPLVRWRGASWAPELSSRVCRDVEAVLIATPPEQHCAPALEALAQGCAVFVEKPFTICAQEALDIAAAVGSNTLMVGHLLVFHPLYARLLSELPSGTLGALRRIHVTRHSPARGNTRCPWWTLAPHDLSLLVRLLGKPQQMNTRFAPNSHDVEAWLSWGDVHAHLDYSTTSEVKRRTWRIETTRTVLSLDESRNSWEQTGVTPGAHTHQRDARGTSEVCSVLPTEPSPLASELRHFATCVAHQHPVATGIEDALRNVELLCWGQRSLARGYRHAGAEPLHGSVL